MPPKQPKSEDYRAQAEELLYQSFALENGAAKVSLLESAVALADAHHDVELGMELREPLLDAACFGGRPDVMIVHFSWCLAQSDRDPQTYPIEDLLWKYKWVTSQAKEFAAIPWTRLEEMLGDMATRFADAGSTGRAVLKLRRDLLISAGLKDRAETAHQAMLLAERDRLADCRACEVDSDVEYALFRDADDEEVLRIAKPILSGRMSCAEVPHVTYPRVLLPLLRLGRDEEALSGFRRGWNLIKDNADMVSSAAEHLIFLGVTGNIDRAAKVLQKVWPTAAASPADERRFRFARAGRFVAESARRLGVEALRIKWPDGVGDGSKGQDPAAYLAHFTAESDELARRFDARNGTDYYRRQLHELAELHAQARPLPLPVKKPTDPPAE